MTTPQDIIRAAPGPLTVTNSGGKHQFRIESDHANVPGEWEDIYVDFSGFFGSCGPQVFAAAPDLLEALRSVYEMCEGYVPNTSKAVWRAAAEAIAKATGERQ